MVTVTPTAVATVPPFGPTTFVVVTGTAAAKAPSVATGAVTVRNVRSAWLPETARGTPSANRTSLVAPSSEPLGIRDGSYATVSLAGSANAVASGAKAYVAL